MIEKFESELEEKDRDGSVSSGGQFRVTKSSNEGEDVSLEVLGE